MRHAVEEPSKELDEPVVLQKSLEQQLAAEQARRADIARKIELIMGKTKVRLKLARETSDVRFNRHFQALKQLSTFVDSSKRMAQTNVLNNQELLRQIQQYQFRQHLKRIVGDQTVLLMDVNKDPLYQELDYEEDREPAKGSLTLGFGHLTEVRNVRRPNIQLDEYMMAKAAIKRAAVPIGKRYSSLPELDEEFITQKPQFTMNQQQANFEDNFFYQQIEGNFDRMQKKIFYQQLNKERDRLDREAQQDKEDLKLLGLAKQFGIDIEGDVHENRDSHRNKVYQMFRKRSQALINEAVDEARTKHLALISKQNEVEHVLLGKQKYSNIVEAKIREWKHQGRHYYKAKSQETSSHDSMVTTSQLPTSVLNSQKSTTMHSVAPQRILLPRRTSVIEPSLRLAQNRLKHYQHVLEEMSKGEREEIEKKFTLMSDDMAQMCDRVDFHRQLKLLGFSEQENHTNRPIRDGGSLKKMVKKSHNRAMKLYKYAD